MKNFKKPYATIVILVLCVLVNMGITFTGGDNQTETAILFGAYYRIGTGQTVDFRFPVNLPYISPYGICS